MDIALVSYDKKSGLMKYAGANNPLWLLRKDSQEVEDISGDRQPVSYFEHATPFKQHEIKVNSGDRVYVFSDGFADQFGGQKGKKLKSKGLKSLFIKGQTKSIQELGNHLNHEFDTWKGDFEQLDDVCVLGLEIE